MKVIEMGFYLTFVPAGILAVLILLIGSLLGWWILQNGLNSDGIDPQTIFLGSIVLLLSPVPSIACMFLFRVRWTMRPLTTFARHSMSAITIGTLALGLFLIAVDPGDAVLIGLPLAAFAILFGLAFLNLAENGEG